MPPANASRLKDKSSAIEAAQPSAAADGRRMRSSRSRQKIASAMLRLVQMGDMSPSAVRVAEIAGVSLRTVFRHFEEMDALYQEMSDTLEAQVRPILEAAYLRRDWRGRLEEMLERRAELYERILPFKTAAGLRRYASAYLQQDYERFLAMERESLEAILPARATASPDLLTMLVLVTGFEAWRSLRQDQGCSPAFTAAAVRKAVLQLIGGL
jgi:AcrR family transcriptional regulator